MQNEKIVLDLTINQINIIIAGLAKLPIEMGLDTFNNVQQQAEKQINAKQKDMPGSLASKIVN